VIEVDMTEGYQVVKWTENEPTLIKTEIKLNELG
jgi:hypothetical protein